MNIGYYNDANPITLVFDDRASVVAMCRGRNIPCCQVADGDF